MATAQNCQNVQINKTKIISKLPESRYFPNFFEIITDQNQSQSNDYMILIKNIKNLKEYIKEESQQVKEEIKKISDIYNQFGIDIPLTIKRGFSRTARIFDKKNENANEANSIIFAPFPQDRTEKRPDVRINLMQFFKVQKANKINSKRIKSISEYKSSFFKPTRQIAKKGIYVPPPLDFDIGSLIVQSFVEVKKKDEINENGAKQKREEEFNSYSTSKSTECSDSEDEELEQYDIPLCDAAPPDEKYMSLNYNEKLAVELKSLGFKRETNKNVLVSNAFCVVNDINQEELSKKVEKTNKAKMFLHEFTLVHSGDIKVHNQNVAMRNFLRQSTDI